MRFALLLVFILTGCATHQISNRTISKIAFGSCMNTNRHPMLDRVLTLDFDLMLMLGDNIYADTTNMTVMARKYDAMKQSPFWQSLRKKAPLLATWDDHDMGGNDAGKDYPLKDPSQKLFHDFLDTPTNSPLRQQQGVFNSALFGPPERRVQVIMLDTRYFRDKPARGNHGAVPSGGPYIPHTDTNTTLLGETQWRWLEEQLRVPAQLRIIGSSIQFISEFSGGEAWANFPHEKLRFLNLLQKTKANGVLFISGDRHWAELSRLDRPGDYPLYDLTSSALTQEHPRGTPTPNKYRANPTTYHHPNVGLILVDWKTGHLQLQLLDVNGQIRIDQKIHFAAPL